MDKGPILLLFPLIVGGSMVAFQILAYRAGLSLSTSAIVAVLVLLPLAIEVGHRIESSNLREA